MSFQHMYPDASRECRFNVASGCSWLHLGATGRSWLQSVASGCSWLHLAAPGWSKLHLAASGFSMKNENADRGALFGLSLSSVWERKTLTGVHIWHGSNLALTPLKVNLSQVWERNH